MRLFTILFFPLVLSISGSGGEIGVDLNALDALCERIGKSETLVVYKGLPRRESLPDDAPEPKKEDGIAIHGYFFFPQPHRVDEKEMRALQKLCTHKDSFKKWRGPKKCGGYHPDYCLQFKLGDTVTEVLLCYGCNEAKIFGKESNLYCDIEEKLLKDLEVILERVTANAKK